MLYIILLINEINDRITTTNRRTPHFWRGECLRPDVCLEIRGIFVKTLLNFYNNREYFYCFFVDSHLNISQSLDFRTFSN